MEFKSKRRKCYLKAKKEKNLEFKVAKHYLKDKSILKKLVLKG